jgi:hypothetical protein
MTRRTDHGQLQQVGDVENSLALLFARQDYRDYFERDGYGAYLTWRVPDFSVVSIHVRNDRYRSLPLYETTRSWFLRDRPLRSNPAADECEVRTVVLRLDRQARRSERARAGFYHSIELERADAGLGGDADYTRALADVRSVLRLSPRGTLLLRLVGGHTARGVLPAQKRFTLGGVDGLRARAVLQYTGNQMVLGQAEYVAALPHLVAGDLDLGLHAIAFVDAGSAWDDPSHSWNPQRRRLLVDGGIGLATSEDDLRVYVARNLQEARSRAVLILRLRRSF